MDIPALWDEINNDPLARGYAGMTDEQVAADLNTVYRTRNRSSISGDEAFGATDPAEFDGLADGSANNSADTKNHWIAFCGRDSIDPFQVANVQFVQQIFGPGSVTVANLSATRTEDVSRAEELGLGTVKTGHVQKARAFGGG